MKRSTILRRLDTLAFLQLCEAAARLADENEQLRRDVARESESAEFWHGEAMSLHEQLAEATGGNRAMTQSGHLTITRETSNENAD